MARRVPHVPPLLLGLTWVPRSAPNRQYGNKAARDLGHPGDGSPSDLLRTFRLTAWRHSWAVVELLPLRWREDRKNLVPGLLVKLLDL